MGRETSAELLGALSSLPFFHLLSKSKQKTLENDWACSGARFPLSAFINSAFPASALFSLFIFAFLLAFSFSFAEALGYALVLFAAFIFASLAIPSMLAKRNAAQIESDLPMALREFALYLKIKMPFEKALSQLAQGSYSSSPIFSQAASAVEGGMAVPAALSLASVQVRSLSFSRAMHHLSVAYEEGGEGDNLILLADEITGASLSSIREYSGKVGFFGLIYIFCSALLPSFFLVISVASTPLSQAAPSVLTIWIFYLAAVPLANAAVLSLLLFSSPPTLSLTDPRADELSAGAVFSSWHLPFDLRSHLLPLIAFFAIFGIALAWLFSFSPISVSAALLISSLPVLALGYAYFLSSSRTSALESELPSSLMSASSHGRFSLEKALPLMSKSSSGPLSYELTSISSQISAGTPVSQALSDAASRTPSVLFRRCLSLLLMGYKSGANMGKAIRQTAEDITSLFLLVRERSSTLSLQRYTLIGAAILVPLILSSVINLAKSLSQAYLSLPPGIFSGAPSSAALLAQASLACQAYLFIFSLETAVFLSVQEGRRERLFFWAVLLALLSQFVWVAASLPI